MRRLIFTFIILALLSISKGDIFAQSVSIVDISPDSPSNLIFEQKVSITFDYTIDRADGARIYIRPITSGNPTPNYAASGSPIFKGKGQHTVDFTIRSGVATVDQLRVQVYNSNQNQLLSEFYFPVEFRFSASKFKTFLNPSKINPNILKVKPKKVIPDTSTSGFYEIPEDAEVVQQIVKPDGTIETHYSEGSIAGITPNNIRYRINPATGDTTFMQMLFIEVQKATPPGFVPLSNDEANQEWLSSLNAWIEYHGNRLLDRIDILLQDEESFKNYMQYEEENSDTIYEQVNIRYTFLEKLYMNNIQ
ncbi:hypothetical protein LQ318_09315 [Aliifodinibius salicampi]|uniref:Uncharacterized protein n=1 Tax=Fodinibius salicampi TaxID=1920655 RepID=A0ABT3PZ87_9BACT|nr:hypothetical protein [Fodinibius salicampi]MCW9713101.1 hypothetical protein [Fodinibius salicampi]